MPDTHIHIHLNGDGAPVASASQGGGSKKKTKKSAPSSAKKTRKVSAYHKTAGKEMKRLRKQHPRMSRANIMKKAHRVAKKKHKR
jgi:hypothetical protein